MDPRQYAFSLSDQADVSSVLKRLLEDGKSIDFSTYVIMIIKSCSMEVAHSIIFSNENWRIWLDDVFNKDRSYKKYITEIVSKEGPVRGVAYLENGNLKFID